MVPVEVTAAIGFVLGAILGSFLSCAAWRIPRGLSLGGRSICPRCGVQLSDAWNVPIVSWLMLRGRSGCCAQRIPVRYLLFELTGASVVCVFAIVSSWMWAFVVVLAVIAVTALISLFTPRVPVKGAEKR